MAERLKPIDIGDNSTLLPIVEEVQADNTSRVLRRDGRDVAMVVPIARTPMRRRRGRVKTEADNEVFLSAAGGWEELIDVDQFIRDIHEIREISIHPPVER